MHRFDPRRAALRVALAAVAGVAVSAVLAPRYSDAVVAFAGWDVGAASLLALIWAMVARATAAETQVRAASQDPGRTAVYVLVVVMSLVSLVAAVILSRRARFVSPGETNESFVILCLAAVALSWTLTHVAFALRYAHLYYREDDEGVGGLLFPGDARPSYFDFAYFAFTVGMCFQVSDVTITSPQLRRTALFHALLAFLYNTAVVAFALNLVFTIVA